MVRWNEVFRDDDNVENTVDFVEGSLDLRTFKRLLDADARREVNKAGSTIRARELARKALRRRSVDYTLVG